MKTQIEATKAKGRAFRLTQEYFIDSPRPVPIEDIAMDKNVVCLDAPLTGCLARLIRKGANGVIRVSDQIQDIGRRRFAIAHEMGHWFLHEAFSQYFICTAEDMLDYSKSPLEAEANIFAAELLMPTFAFRPLAEGSAPSWTAISDLSDTFATSLTATALRFVEFSKVEVLVAFSRNGQIEWVKQKEFKSGLRLSRSGRVSPQSMAYHAFKEGCRQGPEAVPGEAWIAETYSRAVDLVEEAIYMPKINAVISLITVTEADCSTGEDSYDRMMKRFDPSDRMLP